MSVTYPDLNNTVFPDGGIDTFLTYLNITASDGRLVQQYMNAMNQGNQSLAEQVLAQIPAASQKIIKATDLNKMTQAIQAVERFYKTDIEPFVQNKQAEWLDVINRFYYVGKWLSGTSYQKNNMVTYTVNNVELLFLAISDNIPVGAAPTNTTYWRMLTIQGQQGVSGKGLSYRQAWKQGETYTSEDAVTHSGAIWMALKTVTAIEPGTDSSAWKMIMRLEATTYPIQDEQPTNQTEGGLWFNTQASPTGYYKLAPLTNPATAAQIALGYEVYDAQGNKIVGTMATK